MLTQEGKRKANNASFIAILFNLIEFYILIDFLKIRSSKIRNKKGIDLDLFSLLII